MDILTAVILVAAAVCLVAVCRLVNFLEKKGAPVQKELQKAKGVTDAADKIAGAVTEVMPGNRAVLLLDKIIDYANIGVQAAEQMAKSGQISADSRKTEVANYLEAVLKTVGAAKTPELTTAINGAVECAVASLPKSVLPEKIEKQV